MEAVMLLTGVASVVKPPGGPPGKESETPSAQRQNEFKDVLNQAQGKSSGEVAEAEPNAQPQKLDSTEEATLKPIIGDANWTELLGFAVVAPQLIVPTDAMAVVQELPSEPALFEWTPRISLEGVSLDKSREQLVTKDEAATLNIVELVAAKLQPATLETLATPDSGNSAQLEPSPQNALPTAAQLVTTMPTAQPTTTLDVEQDVLTSASSGNVLSIDKSSETPQTESNLEFEGDYLLSEPTAQAETPLSSGHQGNPDSGNSQQRQPGQADIKAVSLETARKVEQSSSMTATERTAVVHQLTRKIEALAVNSVRNEVTVRMEPAELGTVLVQVTRGLGELTASLSATNENLQSMLHETKNELASALTVKTNSVVKVEVIAADSTAMGSSADHNRQPSSQPQSRQEAVTKFFETRTASTVHSAPTTTRLSTSLIDLES